MLKYHIQTITVPSGNASAINFTNIPQNFDDLLLVISSRGNRSASFYTNGTVSINGLTSGYSLRALLAQEASGAVTSRTDLTDGLWAYNLPSTTLTASTFGSATFYFPNYRGSNQKSVSWDFVSENNSSSDLTWMLQAGAGINTTTSPITSINLGIRALDSAVYVEHSSASLYGIKRGVSQITAPATGGEITQANGYWVHAFNQSGTFRPNTSLTNVEYLVIAGGGSGGASNYSANATSGGGGAGGYRSSVLGELSGRGASAESRMNLAANTDYAVVVGAGGNGSTSQFANGGAGSNSSFNAITALGGGFGSSGESGTNGGAGGSGGGGAGRFSTRSGGAGTTGQGFDGGGQTTNINQGGGGGGAGGAGAPQNVGASPSIGGAGLASAVTGVPVIRATGGRGSYDLNPDASANTGSGGAGFSVASAPNRGGNGGSGVVIIRYPIPLS